MKVRPGTFNYSRSTSSGSQESNRESLSMEGLVPYDDERDGVLTREALQLPLGGRGSRPWPEE